jgi:hypothetical protein
VLSTRVLHYTATELLFECKTSYRCECMPDRKVSTTTPSLISKAASSKKTNAVYEAWQHIVEKYSTRDLTVPSDKLPAISGIASKIRQATHSEYLAGIWKGHLASDLLWSASRLKPGSAGCFALKAWRAPSFSWASLDTAITYTQFDDESLESFTPLVTLLGSKVTPKGLNPLGTPLDAFITLHCPVIEAMLCSEQNHESWEYLLIIKGTSSIPMTPDCLLVHTDSRTLGGGGKNSTVRRAQPNETPHSFKAPVRCLNIVRYDNIIGGLVLGLSEGSPDEWERIGTFTAGTEAMQNATEEETTIV